ncbi:glutathione transferase [Aureococcus anophagefferens]|nr:glutathione transferase [Aureococcus anophagefferens]
MRRWLLPVAVAQQYSPHWNITDPQSLATSERRGMLAYTRSRVLDIIAVAPYVLDGVHALFRSGTARAAPVDFERLRQSLYTHARAVETSSAYYVYAGLEDGTFAGYEVARGAVAYSLLHGGACPWNYSAACGGAADDPCAEGYPPAARCFRTYATDNHTGVPLCDPANATPASGATPQLRPQDGCWFDNHASDDAYDPRARPWYEAGGDAFDATGATTQFWSDPYLFSTGVVGVTAGALVSSSDGAFVSARGRRPRHGRAARPRRVSPSYGYPAKDARSHDGDPSALVEDDAEDAVEASSVAWLWNAVRPKIKCAIILFQLLGDMEFVLDVPFPPLYSKVWNALGKVVNIDLVEAVPLGCSFGWGFGTRLVVTTLWPLGAVAGVWLAPGRRRETRGKATHASIAILYVVFPSASQLLFQSFVCENFDYPHSDAFARVLVLDYAVSCRSPRYHAIRFYAALFCAVYPAVPLFFFALLWRHRDRLNPYLDFAAFVDLATPTGGGGLKALAASDDAAARESRAFLRELDEAVPRAKQRVRDGFLEIAPYSLLYRECVLSSAASAATPAAQVRAPATGGAAIIVTLVYIVALARRVDMSDEPRFSREVYRGLLFLCGVVLPLALIALIVARVARRAAAEGDEVEARDAPAERDAPERPRSPLELEAAEREPPPGDDGDDGLYPETTIAFEDITFPEALANAPAMGINGFLCCAQA